MYVSDGKVKGEQTSNRNRPIAELMKKSHDEAPQVKLHATKYDAEKYAVLQMCLSRQPKCLPQILIQEQQIRLSKTIPHLVYIVVKILV